jgi:S-adenosylmethionine decarboxylase proenzyme
MQGLHLTADLSGCRRGSAELTDLAALRTLCLASVAAAGLATVGERFHAFPTEHGEPRGVTGVVLLAESHLAVHTWPELDVVTLDVYVCHRHADNSARAEALVERLVAAFAPAAVRRQRLERGTGGAA